MSAEHELELAFQMLEANDVPRSRARSVHNGIGVLATRLNREAHDTAVSDAADAAKWRALRNCARITAMGSAGCEPGGDSYPGPTAHVTLNFWTHNTPETETYSRRWLDKFVEKAIAAQLIHDCPDCEGKGCVECDGPDHRCAG